MEQWRDAETIIRIAIELHETDVDRIHLAEALLYKKKIDDACIEIDKLHADDLTSPALDDYSLTYAAIAIWSEKQERLENAKRILKNYNPSEPYFRERRLHLLLTVTEGINRQIISQTQKDETTPKSGFLAFLTKFVMLQPNLAGIGLNFNAIFDEIAARKKLKPLEENPQK